MTVQNRGSEPQGFKAQESKTRGSQTQKNDDDKKTVVVTLNIPIEVCQQIDALARKDERTRAYWIRTAIKERLEREERILV